MKSPIQLMIEQLESVKRDEPRTMIHNLKQFANDLLVDEKHMVADAWRAGNKDGWDMSTDWPEDGERYYEKKYTGKHGT
jgi:hypothetical protein